MTESTLKRLYVFVGFITVSSSSSSSSSALLPWVGLGLLSSPYRIRLMHGHGLF